MTEERKEELIKEILANGYSMGDLYWMQVCMEDETLREQIILFAEKYHECMLKNNNDIHLVSKSFYSDDAIARLKTEYFEKGLKANK